MIKWLKERSKKKREAQRAHDVEHLFPQIWRRMGGDLSDFMSSACMAICMKPAWKINSEWSETDQNPGKWAARKINERQ
jgi:hypothetical protein